MKILYHHRVASKDGQYVHISEILKVLDELGHDVEIVAPKLTETSSFGSDGGWVTKLKKSLPQAVYELLEFSYTFLAFFKLFFSVLTKRPDIIYERYNILFPAGIWIAKFFKLPIILEVNAPLYHERLEYGGVSVKWLSKWTESYTWRNADVVLPVTQVLAEYVESVGVSPNRIHVIPNGVDTEIFNPDKPEMRDPKFEGKLVVGFVGFCREWHHLDEVMKLIAAQQDKDICFLVVGDGPVINDLKHLAIELGFSERFICTGVVGRKDIPFWLHQMDIAIQPAVTPWASPLKLLEYLAMRKAIVAADTPNIRELLQHETNALLFDNKDLSAMMEALEHIFKDDDMRKRISEGAYRTIVEHDLTWLGNGKRIEKLAHSLLKANNNHGVSE